MKQNQSWRLAPRLKPLILSAPLLSFIVLLIVFAGIGSSFGVDVLPAGFSFALLFAPYWFFGFGIQNLLIRRLHRAWMRLAFPCSLLAAWLVFVVPHSQFSWPMFTALLLAILAICGLLELGRNAAAPHWCDWAALAILALAVELPFFRNAWPAPGLTGFSKLLFVDVGLYGFLVIRPIGGIGYDLRPQWADFRIGLREFCLYTPVALLLGFALGFLHWHPAGLPLARFAAAWLFTLFFVALPEEIFFRGLLMNLLDRRWGPRVAFAGNAILFGLAHFPKRATFNWRYVILAAIAGVFYSRAWWAKRRVLTSGVTHATVDAVWSVWFR